MIIRPEQIKAFAPVIEKEFASRLADHIKSRHGESVIRLGDEVKLVKAVPKDVLDGLVLAGIHRAKKHGLTSESTQSGFVVLMFEIAPNFDDDPAAREILHDLSIEEENRVEELNQRLRSADWGRMNRRYDHKAWQAPEVGGKA
jgi:hypothetical protein